MPNQSTLAEDRNVYVIIGDVRDPVLSSRPTGEAAESDLLRA